MKCYKNKWNIIITEHIIVCCVLFSYRKTYRKKPKYIYFLNHMFKVQSKILNMINVWYYSNIFERSVIDQSIKLRFYFHTIIWYRHWFLQKTNAYHYIWSFILQSRYIWPSSTCIWRHENHYQQQIFDNLSVNYRRLFINS